jgi:transposase-like protein
MEVNSPYPSHALAQDEEYLQALVRRALHEVLEAEMAEALCAGKGERMRGGRLSCASSIPCAKMGSNT